MAWVRRVRTASGATAVQIAESVAGRRRIVRHVGSARDEGELGLLIAEANRLLARDAQHELDLGLTPVAPKAVMAPAPAQELFPGQPQERRWVRRAHVLKTSSGLLYEALAGVYTGLGFDAVGDEVFRDLVIARVVEPTSLLDLDRVLAELGRSSASLSTRKRTLRRACAGGYRDTLAAACLTHAATHGDVTLVLYDVTTLYFEAEHEDELRKVGYSKERRVDPQIVVGLLVDRRGFPLEVGCFEGNKAETATIVPIIRQFQERHGIEGMVIVADAGMLSASNLKALDEAGLRFIVGSRVTKAPADLASHFRWHGDAFTDGQHVDTITPRIATKTAAAVNDQNKRAEPVWDPAVHPTSWRAVWAYSTKRAVRDGKTLTMQWGCPRLRGRTAPRPSSPGRRLPGPHGLSPSRTAPDPWTPRRWRGPAAWPASKGMSPISPPRSCPQPRSSRPTTTYGTSKRPSGCPRPTCAPGPSSTTPATRSRRT